MRRMAVVDFHPSHAEAFRSLNEAWITRLFALEARDREVLGDPVGHILAPGGQIFIALDEGEPAGCCALMAMADGGFELCKMAVDEGSQGKGLAKALIGGCVAWARARGARRLYLESNSRLAPALGLYRASGFTDIPPERRPVSPYSRADVWMELRL